MIEYDVVASPTGPCVVGVRRGKVALLRLGKGTRGLTGRPRRLPAARRWLADWFRGVEGDARLDLSWATDFERRVYRVVRRIRPGRTLTYGQVAGRAGRPGAARAVGNAMARNRICLFIP
jgi:O6-methylguanine-DNA--protein-cysteine methyltransferase